MALKRIVVKQTGSAIRRPKDQKLAVKALGLGRIGRTIEHDATDSIIGMIKKVSHLVEVREASDAADSE